MKYEPTDKLILVVDDNEIWGTTIMLWLQQLGLKNTKCFNTVEEFMTFYKEHQDEVEGCVVDYYLDSGIIAPEVIKQIRELNNSVLIASFCNTLSVYCLQILLIS